VFTTIEFGIAAPLFFFLANMDAIAVPILYIMLALSIITQIPKRFLFRKRPYMQGRAKCLAKDHTSSFPSRAVTYVTIHKLTNRCGAIYGFFVGIVLQETLQPEWWFHFYSTVPITVFLVLASAFGRIYLGVHFPSDCLFSLVQAGISIGVGIGSYYLQSLLCNYCGDGSCYGREHIVLDENVAHVNWYLFAIASVTWLLVAVLSSIKPLEFYVKFHHVFGLLLPCLTFQWVFLCPGLSLNGKSALEHPDDPQWYSWIVSVVYISFMTLFGMKAKKISIIAFIIIYSLTLALLVLWRGYYM
jgi:hypothetical protein